MLSSVRVPGEDGIMTRLRDRSNDEPGLVEVAHMAPPDDRPGRGDERGAESEATDEHGDGAVEAEKTEAVAYELVFDCRDERAGLPIMARIESVVGPTWEVRRGERGPTWSLTIEFPSQRAADRFFCSDFYSRICTEVRRQCASALLVVPLGPVVDREQ